LPVIKADDQLHVDRHFAAEAFDDPNDVGILTARRHEIDQAHGAAFRFDLGFQNERVVSIPAPRSLDFLIGMEKPTAIFSGAEERRKASRRIESRKAKPINAAVATHERASLCVTEKRVVLDFRVRLCHFLLSSSS
jgi:hypothetical protein